MSTIEAVINLTDDERAKFPAGTPAIVVLAHRVVSLGVRLNRIDGQRESADDALEQLRKRVQAIEVGLEQSDFMREIDGAQLFDVSDLERASRERDEARSALFRLCDALGVLALRGVDLCDIPARIGEALERAEYLCTELERERERRNHFSSKLTEARIEQEGDLVALFEALDARPEDPTARSRVRWREAIEIARDLAGRLDGRLDAPTLDAGPEANGKLTRERDEARDRSSKLEAELRDLRDNDAREIAKLREQRDEAREERDALRTLVRDIEESFRKSERQAPR